MGSTIGSNSSDYDGDPPLPLLESSRCTGQDRLSRERFAGYFFAPEPPVSALSTGMEVG